MGRILIILLSVVLDQSAGVFQYNVGTMYRVTIKRLEAHYDTEISTKNERSSYAIAFIIPLLTN